jgi:hypothetical protein
MFANTLLKPVRPLAVDLLAVTDFEFYLTDQRFFSAQNHGWISWVFFAENTPAVHQLLEDMGFCVDERMALHAQELGCLTAYVKRIKGGEISELEPHEADTVVRIVSDARKYSAIQNSMHDVCRTLPADTWKMKDAWQLASVVFDAGMKYAEENTVLPD